jgi:quercetin dioxygenase-like cupin family protein
MLPLVDGGGSAHAVVWPGVGAEMRSMVRVRLEAGARTVALQHPMEAVYYVIAGSGAAVEPGNTAPQPLVEGSMAHIEPGTTYRFEAGPDGIEIIGGPCPADPALFKRIAT